MKCATFPKSARLQNPADFKLALKGKRIARGELFTLRRAPFSNDITPTPSIARLGLVIGKRYAAKATTRNTLKRIAREAFRLRRQQLPAGDYVLLLSAPVRYASLTQIKKSARSEIDALFDKV